jgi:4a-hydroxytetrahydrobiopterin dehydratase
VPEVLSHEAVDRALAERGLPWERVDDELVRVVRLADFAKALAFVDAVGWLAEVANHHPDVDIRWGTVTLRLTTHSAGGLTRRDLDLAASIEGLTPDAPA